MNRAVFLDRDGVLNEPVVRDGKPYPPADASELVVTAGAAAALARLRAAGFRLIVVTNQPDIARGTTSRAAVDAIDGALAAALSDAPRSEASGRGLTPPAAALDAFYVCPHDDADRCVCRKPLPGLLLAASRDHAIDLAGSYMIGDRWRDIDAGAAAGCRTVLIDRGYRERPPHRPPDYRVATLPEAAAAILSERTGPELAPT